MTSPPRRAGMRGDPPATASVRIPTEGGAVVDGDLVVPAGATGVVAFAHGSGSGRHSPRNRHVAEVLQAGGLATLLMDLLTLEEEAVDAVTRELRFDIGLLSQRTVDTLEWLVADPATAGLAVGLFGASTGAAAALVAAALRPDLVRAVVSRGGRPDLAAEALGRVRAPTLLVVGGEDRVVIRLNRDALAQLGCERELRIVPGATHLFEEPGTLDVVAALAREWFVARLGPAARRPEGDG
jgi:putative phosphoribosyl transferase